MNNDNESLVQLGRAPSTLGTEDNTRQSTSTVHGGVTRVSHFSGYVAGPEDHSAAQHAPSTRVITGPVKYTVGAEEAQQSGGIARHVGGLPDSAVAGIAATLSSTYGPATVDIPGFGRTRVEVAERMGLVRYEGDRLVDVVGADGKPATAAEPQGQEQKQADPGAGVFDPQDDEAWAADIEPLPQVAHDAALASGVAVIAHGVGDLDQVALGLARGAGIDPGLAADYVHSGRLMFQEVADRAMAAEGLTGERLEQAYESMRKQPAKLQHALQGLLYGRDVSGFRELAVQFKRQSPGDLTSWHRAGFETHVDQTTGDVLVKRGTGGWRKASDLGK